MHVRVLSSPRSRSWVRRILRRFRARGTRPEFGSVIRHRAVNLLPGHGASTSMKERGTRILAMDTSGACSSYSTRGELLEAMGGLTLRPRASSCTARGSSTGVTATRGANGEPLGRADFTNRGVNE